MEDSTYYLKADGTLGGLIIPTTSKTRPRPVEDVIAELMAKIDILTEEVEELKVLVERDF